MKKLILGATGSIGSSLAKKIVSEGGEVHLVGRDKTSLSKLASELNSTFTSCDVLEENFAEKVFNDLGDTPINGLAYCVGSIDLKPIKLTKKSDYMQSFNLNLISATEIIRRSTDSLKQNKGSIVLFSTVAVKRGFTNHSIIASAKGAIEGLTVSLAAELAPDIRVNCIAPSLTESNMTKKLTSNEVIKKSIETLHPIPRLGQGDDFAKLSSFLLGNNNKWITGQIIHVDGGRSTLRKKG